MKKFLAVWLILMIAGAFSVGTACFCTQQSLRLGANESAAALAKDTLIKLENGALPEEAVSPKTDIRISLEPFVMIYDNNKQLVATSAGFGSENIAFPKSVLENITKNGDSRVTWQPEKNLRFASVGIKYDGGYIVAAVSLYEKERLIDSIVHVLLLASAAYAVGCALLLYVISIIINKKTCQNSAE